MEEILKRIKSIEDKLSTLHEVILDVSSTSTKNFEVLDKSMKEEIKKLKEEIKKGE